MKADEIKTMVNEKYSEIAKKSMLQNPTSCCGTSTCCGENNFSMIGEEYSLLEGHHPDADLGLGCGIPTNYAGIKEGDSVLDLGSGAGNDCFVARAIVGEKGKITGLDFSDAMLVKANENVRKLGYSNVEFIKGDIEQMPLADNQFDVVVSNCVLNLVPNKKKAFAEIKRVLKNGGHFCISDVVLKGNLPAKLQNDAAMYAGCVSGAIKQEEYLDIISQQGFQEVIVHKQRAISIPVDILKNYLTDAEIKDFLKGDSGIFSITVSGNKVS